MGGFLSGENEFFRGKAFSDTVHLTHRVPIGGHGSVVSVCAQGADSFSRIHATNSS